MTKPNQLQPSPPEPTPQSAPDLVTSDAQAFMEANQLGTSEDQASPSAPKPDQGHVVNQAILLSNGIRPVTIKRATPPWIYIAVAVALLIALALSYLATKPNGSASNSNSGSSTGLGVPQAPGSSSSQGLDNQIQNDVKTCSNIVNAALSC